MVLQVPTGVALGNRAQSTYNWDGKGTLRTSGTSFGNTQLHSSRVETTDGDVASSDEERRWEKHITEGRGVVQMENWLR